MVTCVRSLALVWLAAFSLSRCRSACNMSKYQEWYDSTYSELLEETQLRVTVDRKKGFWGLSETLRYTEYNPTNGMVMEKAARFCRQSMQALTTDLSGRSGEMTGFNIWGAMCSAQCQDSDVLHLEAMRQSDCDCLELSPTSSDAEYSTEGEFCKFNSARIMCTELERCSTWECRLGDFMCPRHEYNKEWIRFRGLGDCSAAARPTVRWLPLCAALALITAQLIR